MRAASFCFAALSAFLALSGPCLAHKVNVFAFVDGDEIQVECGFSRSQKVKNGRLLVTDLETGDTLLEGVANDRGIFRFRPPEEFLLTGHGLNIRLLAGEGHQDDWKISAEELRALASGASVPAPGRSVTPQSLDAERLETIIGRLMDAKLAPINLALARLGERDHDWRDVIGGIGWILGLLGLATYLKYRR